MLILVFPINNAINDNDSNNEIFPKTHKLAKRKRDHFTLLFAFTWILLMRFPLFKSIPLINYTQSIELTSIHPLKVRLKTPT